MAVTDIPRPLRTEVEIAADAAWSLIEAGIVPRTVKVAHIAQVVGVSVDDLRLASIRAGRVPAERRRPRNDRHASSYRPPAPDPQRNPPKGPTSDSPRPSLPPEAYDHQPLPAPGDRGPVTRLTPAGRRGAAEAVFAMWKVRGALNCTRCGKPMESGCEVIVTAARHAEHCT